MLLVDYGAFDVQNCSYNFILHYLSLSQNKVLRVFDFFFQTLDVVVELKGASEDKVSLTPQRFVLVIDVSGSMGDPVFADDDLSLLDRMKVSLFQF